MFLDVYKRQGHGHAADARGVHLGQQHEDDRADGDGTTEDIEKEEEQQERVG